MKDRVLQNQLKHHITGVNKRTQEIHQRDPISLFINGDNQAAFYDYY